MELTTHYLTNLIGIPRSKGESYALLLALHLNKMKGELKKQKNKLKWDKETQNLTNFLYENELYDNAEVTQFSPYHFRIKGKMTVDIWAGSKKYFIHGMSGSAQYDNINELKKYLC